MCVDDFESGSLEGEQLAVQLKGGGVNGTMMEFE